MKRFFYLIFIFFIFTSKCFATSDTAEVIYAKAYSHIYRNNPKAAISIFEKGINNYPDCSFLYAGLGDAYMKENDYSKALDAYTNAQKKKNSSTVYKIDFYNAYVQKNMKDISNALDTLFSITKNSDNPILYRNINNILQERYLNTQFITEIYLNTSDEQLNKINLLKANGQKEAALNAYLKLCTTNPKNFQAANNAGVILIELKDYKLAEKYLLLAYESNKNSALILNNLAISRLYLQKYKEMNENFKEAIKVNSDYIPVLNNESIAKIHEDIAFYKTQNAETLLDISTKDNENLYALRILSKMYVLKGDYVSAYNLLMPIGSNYNFKLYSQKAFVAYKAAKYSQALSYINTAISMYSDNASDYVLRARIQTALGQLTAARNDFQTAMSKDKKNLDVNYHYARMLYQNADKDTAYSIMRNYISLKKGNSQTPQISILFE